MLPPAQSNVMRFYTPTILTSGVIILFEYNSLFVGQISPSLNLNPDGIGCVDPKGFVSCYAAVSGTASSNCPNDCEKDYQQGTNPYKQCLTACNDNWYAGNIGCWIQSCWNQVGFHHFRSFLAYRKNRYTPANINSLQLCISTVSVIPRETEYHISQHRLVFRRGHVVCIIDLAQSTY